MELWVCFFTITICCLVCAVIHGQKWLRNGRNFFIYSWLQFGYGSQNKRPSLKCVEELRTNIQRLGSMQISESQCQLLRSKCLSCVQRIPPDSILFESYCAVRRALKLMQDCCTENWLLKALEFGNGQQHFVEILRDLHRLPTVERLASFSGTLDEMAGDFGPTDISGEVRTEMHQAWEDDKENLRSRIEVEIRQDGPKSPAKHYLAKHYLAEHYHIGESEAPPEIVQHVKEFNILLTKCYKAGSDSIVFPVTFCEKKFVIKMDYSKCGAGELQNDDDNKLQKEADIMKECRHPYAVGLLGCWEITRDNGPKVPLLLMESMDCDLKQLIEGNKKKQLIERDKKRLKRWLSDPTGGFPALDAINLVLPVAKVMRYLHSIGVVHRDLKSENILFTRVQEMHLPEDVSVKLADFGESQKVGAAKFGFVIGTIGYMDPKVWDKETNIDFFKADVFSFGMVFGEVLTGLSPKKALHCRESDRGEIFYNRIKSGKRPPLPKGTPQFLKDIVESCWDLNPEARPSFEEICWKLQNTQNLLVNRRL